MANTDLLRKTMQHIRGHPDTWSQIDYRRGATGCFAYHAALLAGGELAHPAPTVPRPSGGEPYPNHDAHLRCNGVAQGLGFSHADEIHLKEFARRALGLNPKQAGDLFWAGNNLADLERLVQEYTASSTAGGSRS